MDELLQRLQKVVAAYNPRRKDSHVRVLRALAPVVAACRQYIKDNSATDKGCAQRLSRQLDMIICALPDFRHYAEDAHSRHNRRLAEAHLDEIQNYLKSIVSQEENKKRDKMRAWVHEHPVLKELCHVAVKKPLPKEAYVLLFERRVDEETVELVTRDARDTLVLTRFRPREFSDELHVHKMFHGKVPIVGAAVICGQQLIAGIGELPAAAEGKQQIDIMLSMSKEAASQPAIEYIEQQPVLKQLHELVRERAVPKDAFILLFRRETGLVTRVADGGRVLTRFRPLEFRLKYRIFELFRGQEPVIGAAVIKEKELLHAIGELPQPEEETQSALDVLLRVSSSAVEQPAVEFVAANDVLKSLHELATSERPPRKAYAVLFAESPAGRLEMHNGARGPRFDLNDFRSVRAIYDRFGSGSPVKIVGASVIGEPPPRVSPRPAAEGNEEAGEKRAASGGRSQAAHGTKGDRTGGAGGGHGARRDDRAAAAGPKRSVLHAFGRTPLKQHLLATAENFKRMGLEAAAPPSMTSATASATESATTGGAH